MAFRLTRMSSIIYISNFKWEESRGRQELPLDCLTWRQGLKSRCTREIRASDRLEQMYEVLRCSLSGVSKAWGWRQSAWIVNKIKSVYGCSGRKRKAREIAWGPKAESIGMICCVTVWERELKFDFPELRIFKHSRVTVVAMYLLAKINYILSDVMKI